VDSTLALALGLAAIFVALTLALVTLGTASSQRRQVGRSLAAVNALHAAPSAFQQELNKPFAERVLDPGMARLSRLGRRLTREDQLARIRHRLELAGNPPQWDVDRVIALKLLGCWSDSPCRCFWASAPFR
jgi:tight adherence protein C